MRKVVANWDDLQVSAETRESLDAPWFSNGREHKNLHMAQAYLDASMAIPDSGGLGQIPVTYRRTSGAAAGRQWAATPSMQRLARPIRHTIARVRYNDIDMKNAFPTLIVQYCELHGIPCPTIAEYVSARDQMLSSLGVPRDFGKRIVLAVLGGGTRDMNSLRRRPEWLRNIKAESETIQNYMIANTEHRDLVMAARSRAANRQHENLGGMVLSSVLQEIEDQILMAMVRHMEQSSVPVCGIVLVFDGFMIPTTAATVDTSFLVDLEAAAEASTGWRIQLAVKPMDEGIDLSGLTRMTEDVTWQSSPSALIPPTHTSGAGIFVAKPRTDCAAQASTSLTDHLFAHLPDSAAVARLAQSERALQEVLVDADRPVRLFFRLSFAAAHVASTDEVVTQFLDGVVAPRLEALIGSRPRAQVAIAHNAAITVVHIVMEACAPTLTECYRVCSQMRGDALAYQHLLPALRRAVSKADTLLDMTVYTEGQHLPILGTSESTTVQRLTAYGIGVSASSFETSDHLITAEPLRFPVVNTHRSQLNEHGLQHRIVATQPMRAFSEADNVAYSLFLNSWHQIPTVFGGDVEVISVACINGNAHVALNSQACPFGGHGAGHVSRLVLNDVTRSARVECEHHKCSRHSLRIQDAPMSITDALDRVRTGTLHTQAQGVRWSERYSEPQMRPLPNLSFVCVRAQMGLGKTKEIIKHVGDTCTDDTSILVVSYSIELCKRLHVAFNEGTGLDFALYSDQAGDIVHKRVVVCLDSLPRCALSKFDMIIIDEVHSVFKHFNSQHMKESGLISHKLERLLVSSGRVIFADAVCDSTLVKSVVDRVEASRGTPTCWVCNDHVRPTSRRMDLFVADGYGSRAMTGDSLQYGAMNATCRRLDAGENVVYVSNLKNSVVAIEKLFKERYPKEQPYAAYYGEGPRKLHDPAEEWPGLRLLAYSPTITAGISYEGSGFDSLVAYIDITPYAPDIDTVLQMLYRVRALHTGSMEIYLATPTLGMHLPHTVQEVTELLLGSHELTKRYLYNLRVHFDAIRKLDDDGSALFDRSRMSWDILVGSIVCKNRSLVNAVALLTKTMSEDYGVPVTVHHLKAAHGDDAILDPAAALNYLAPEAEVPFSELELDIDDLRAREIDASFNDGCDAVALASFKLYKARVRLEVARHRVDEQFYKTFVCGSGKMHGCLKRWAMRLRYSSQDMRVNFSTYVSQTLSGSDPNLDVHKNPRGSHLMAIHGQELLEAVLNANDLQALDSFHSVQMQDVRLEESVNTVLQRYNKNQSDGGKSELAQLEGLFLIARASKGKKKGDQDVERSSDSKAYKWFSKVLKVAFHMDVTRGSRDKRRSAYHSVQICPAKVQAMVLKYQPAFMPSIDHSAGEVAASALDNA